VLRHRGKSMLAKAEMLLMNVLREKITLGSSNTNGSEIT